MRSCDLYKVGTKKLPTVETLMTGRWLGSIRFVQAELTMVDQDVT
jgi:hypothetical protein